jgi:ABC-type oligopeptide transport system ATPase subunit
MTNIVYLIGYSGTGKYTIARELAKSGYIICDNQLINTPVFTLLNADGFSEIPEYAWESIRKIRDNILEFIQKEPHNSYILTNVLYESVIDKKIYEKVLQIAKKRNSSFFPIKLLISREENIKRITQPSRKERWKAVDPFVRTRDKELINISHPNLLELDVTSLSPENATKIILKHIKVKLEN